MKNIPIILTLVLLLGLLAISFVAWAQNEFKLPWHTIDGGGAFSTGGSYSLGGSIGQSDAGSMSGGVFNLDGGFWRPSRPTPTATVTPDPELENKIFLPIVIR